MKSPHTDPWSVAWIALIATVAGLTFGACSGLLSPRADEPLQPACCQYDLERRT